MLSLTVIAPLLSENNVYIDAGGSVSNIRNSRIKANNLTIIAAGDFNNVAADATVGDIGGLIDVSTNFTIEADDFSNVSNNHNIVGVIDVGTLNLSLAGNINYADDIKNHGTISANNQFFTSRNGNFTNTTNIDLEAQNNFGVTANNFINTSGSIDANTISLSIAGDFNYQTHYLNNGTITENNLYLTARNGDFINNTILTAANLGITANNFNNAGGTINVSKH